MSDRYVQLVFPTPLLQEFTYRLPENMKAVPGCRVVASFGRRQENGFVVGEAPPPGLSGAKPGFVIKDVLKVLDDEPIFDDTILKIARWISEMYFCSLGEALGAMLPGARQEREIDAIVEDSISPDPSVIHLSTEQQAGLAQIRERSEGMFYLYGLTGSGKTEVFLQAAALTIAEGRSVIYLVPEIALTRQVIHAIEARFKGQTAVLHSRLTPSQRLKQWRRIQRGEARLVIGARSAVFAPVQNLGLLIVDEEHESSYKSSSTPRYHARQVAMRRCIDAKARLIMGSATPSVEAWQLMETGKLSRIQLTKRLAGGGMPHITVVPLAGQENSLSAELVAEIQKTHELGKQTILFLNRRGFSHFFHCRSCHHELSCKRCSVGYTYHKSRNIMMCHYCGSVTRPPTVCPACGSLDVGYAGFGTEKVEEDVARLFPALRIGRIDADSIQKKGSLERIISDFRNGSLDLLLGTQMVAKGLNFPGVRLVGIVNADTGLHLPDFRSAERTFSLITQVAGRAGRYTDDGLVFIQTFKPETPAISRAATGDIEAFYREELVQRKLQVFPPYSRLIRLVFRGKDMEKTLSAAREFAQNFGSELRSHAELLGPAECPLSRVNNNSRFQILLVSRDFSRCHTSLGNILKAYKTPSGMYLEIDTDPVSLL